MTDKEIRTSQDEVIIDGVNVAGCEFCEQLSNGKNTITHCRIKYCYCKDYKKCYFKQLKRKEQECEKLKEEYNEYVKTHHYNNAEFKQERDSLIQEISHNNQYKQALQKIKIAIDECSCTQAFSIDGDLYNQIIDIINEVSNNDK